jgi:hypothetical protein
VCPTESLFAFLALLNRKSKKKLVDAMGFSEFKLDPTKQNKTTSLIYIYIYIYYCKEKKEKEESKLPDHLELASCRVVTVGIVRFRGDN